MNRGVITISESGTVSMPTDTVWMTMQEIADMYNVFGCYVCKALLFYFFTFLLFLPFYLSPRLSTLSRMALAWASSCSFSAIMTTAFPMLRMPSLLRCWKVILRL